MRKRILSAALTFVLCLSLLPSAALAAEGLENFKQVNTYAPGTFTDVSANEWYAENVQTAYELGLVMGSSETTFNPNGSISVASTLALACRLHSIYHTGTAEFTQGTPWYAVYVDYAVNNGIITQGQFSDYNADATRRQFAAIMVNALPAEALEEFNTVEDGMIPDVAAGSANYDAIYLLYRAGILTGNDSKGTFAPDTSIGRSSVAALVTRMAVPALRQSVTLKAIPATGVTLDPAAVTLFAGANQTVAAVLTPADATVQTLTWSSSNPAVATVSGGVITGVSAGSATITCEAASGVKAQCTVTVNAAPVNATGISISGAPSNVQAGDTFQLTASLTPSNANSNNTVTWSSTNTAVATVSSTGMVTAVAAGSADIVATLPDGTRANVRIQVQKASVRIVLRDSLPMTLSEYGWRDELESTWHVTDFRYEIADYSIIDPVEQTVFLFFSGEKVFDSRGSGQGDSCNISWQLYDGDGYVVDSGTCYSPAVRMGEKFRDAQDYIFDLKPGTYYLELHSTN